MAPSSSSTRKAAKLAQKGKGKRVRFQGGTLFPMVVAIVLVLGLALIVYARTSRPAADASAPQIYRGQDASGQTIGDHWHGAYGFQICSDFPNVQLAGDLEAKDTQGNLISQAMQTTGIHSHDDGVIHWHAWSSRASGRNAQIGVFLDNYEVSLSDDTLEFPEGDDDNPLSRLIFVDANGTEAGAPDDFPLTYEEGETQCGGEDADLRVVVWTDYTDPDSQQVYRSNFADIPFDQNGLVITIAFVPDDVEVVMPSWAANLPELGAIDSGTGVIPDGSTAPDTTTDGTSADDTTEASGDTTTASDTTEATEAADSTEAADTTEASDTTEAADTTEG